ncbi:stage VI sporulation protein D [Salipaludibacillus sp. CUR1]|uniref:stage VI sporulation protein D n=1 Tax=Salipaludibacillus sp. CUR1 TaxID=2820003 RepID=UPI001E35E1BA|nr:stage VI sporulation protein D [Salipaludibacillus sp. CUR1]MCE7793477.1 stage VI sporulation protein D [Salipaludibacillus sp. CUR1]
MTNEGSSLSFSMKEGIWLERGNEVDELISLSLEPDISVNESENEVVVKGALHLTGEYRMEREEGTEEENEDENQLNQMVFRSVEEVSLSENGIGEIRHQFPLDITIPKERVENLEDIYLTVEGFDYEVPESGYLEISADLSILGIRSGEEQAEVEDNYKEDLTDRTFSFEQVRAEDIEENEETEKEAETVTDLYEEEREEEYETEAVELDESDPVPGWEERPPAYTLKAGPSDDNNNLNSYESSSKVNNEEDYSEENRPETESAGDYNKEAYEDEAYDERPAEAVPEEPEDTEAEQAEAAEAQEKERDQSDSSESENALYLTKMLSGDKEEAYSKLRMCIVQNGESLNTIADRYEMQVSQLMRMNRLKDEQVDEGQILYIPVRKPSSD